MERYYHDNPDKVRDPDYVDRFLKKIGVEEDEDVKMLQDKAVVVDDTLMAFEMDYNSLKEAALIGDFKERLDKYGNEMITLVTDDIG